ncbi:hypothetical protein ACLBKU_07450 [Erythrobacter sp. NE805]|uniref:hypothetical protein n=1 Tax=Erythrobacter sp. NE805 TaxID=3389875 RepID=UPI00396B1658
MASFDLGKDKAGRRSVVTAEAGTSLREFFSAFPDDAACLAHVFSLHDGGNPDCPRCGQRGRWQRHARQKHYFHPCGGIVSPMMGTLLERSRIPVQLWFYAMLHFANSHESIPAPFLAKELGVSAPTAYRVGSRIRQHLAALDAGQRLGSAGGVVTTRLTKIRRIVNDRANKQNAAMVLVICDGSRVDCTIVAQPRTRQLRKVVALKCHRQSKIVTDCFVTFKALSNYGSNKPIAEFSPSFERRSETERSVHGFLQYLNLSFADQFKGVQLDHAWQYFKEYEFRYNRRHRSGSIFWDMVARFPPLGPAQVTALEQRNFFR